MMESLDSFFLLGRFYIYARGENNNTLTERLIYWSEYFWSAEEMINMAPQHEDLTPLSFIIHKIRKDWHCTIESHQSAGSN